jgi:uncharacterized protein YvpB
MARHTEEEVDESDYVDGFAPPGAVTILSVNPGEYVIFPNGVASFAKKYGAEAVNVDPDGSVYVLREGLTKNKLRWVDLVEDVS